MTNIEIGIKGLGIYEPDNIVEVEKIKNNEGLKDELIDYIGIKQLRTANDREHPSDMAVLAAQNAIKSANIDTDEIGVLIYTNTFLSEYNLWANYSYIQNKLKIKKAFSFVINQACNSQLLAFDYGRAKLYMDKSIKYVLVVSSERWDSNYINRFTSAASCFYGDGASAAILSRDSSDRKILDLSFHTDGYFANMHYIPAGGTKKLIDADAVNKKLYRFEPRKTCKEYLEDDEKKRKFWNLIIENNMKLLNCLLEKNNLTYKDIKFVITYNMSKKIIKTLSDRIGKKLTDTSYYIAKLYGHIGSSDICFNLTKMIQDRKFKKNDYVVLISAGFGFSWGAGIIRI